MRIRTERAGDRAAIHGLVEEAFGGPREAKLVDALRNGGALAVSLVAEDEGRLIGHVALSRLKSPSGALALAPVAVSPQRQRRGVGSLLVREALGRARRGDWEIVFVVGDPAYYSRFGFSAEAAAPFPCLYAGRFFMALWLAEPGGAPEPVIYAEPFNDLE